MRKTTDMTLIPYLNQHTIIITTLAKIHTSHITYCKMDNFVFFLMFRFFFQPRIILLFVDKKIFDYNLLNLHNVRQIKSFISA